MLYYKIYIVYIDLITTLIIGVLSSTITPISTFSGAFVSEIDNNPCLRLFVVILQDLHCLQRFYHNVDHWGIELYYHKNFIFSRPFISQTVWPPLIIHGLRLFLFILQEVHCLQNF